MRRTILLALLAALLFAPPALAAGTRDILRDCADDGILNDGDYSASDLRSARNQIPAELEEYSDCRDVLSREIAAKTAASNPGGTGGGGTGTGTGGVTGGTITSPGTLGGSGTAPPQPTGKDPGVVTGPSSPQDWAAVGGAMQHGGDAIQVNGRPVKPATQVGRNGLPGTVIAVLALLAAAALASTVPFVRRRAVTHQPA